MTPTEEARFIQLWAQGASYRTIAQALSCALGTVASRAAALAAQGKIQPRPRGGTYPRQQAQIRPARTPASVQSGADMHGARAVWSGAVQTTMHRAEPVQNSAEVPVPAALAEELGRLWAAIEALRQDRHRPVHDTVQSLPEPLFDDPADNATERWNLYLKHGLRRRVDGRSPGARHRSEPGGTGDPMARASSTC